MTRALMLRCQHAHRRLFQRECCRGRDPVDGPLAGFCTEYLSGGVLNTMAATLKVPEDRRNFGRWLPKQSDNYLLSASSGAGDTR
jgi:hypothetical protein